MTSGGGVHRRSFVVGGALAVGGLALGFALPWTGANTATADGAAGPAAGAAPELNCWIVIAPDDTVTIRTAFSEMGQGATTGLAMLVAEELGCDWQKIRTEFVPPEDNLRRRRIWGIMSTGASRSITTSHLTLRSAGAAAREMLVAAAAARWNVPAAQCSAKNSVISHPPSGRSVTFGAVAADAAKLTPPEDLTLKEPKEWTLIGTPQRRLDVLEKITGRPIYAIDLRLPDMLHAAIRHSPVFGGTLRTVDENAIAAMPGVRRVVKLPDAVAVIADSWWRAKCALDRLPVTWDDNGNAAVSTASIAASVRAALDAGDAPSGRNDGDVEMGFACAARCIEAEYAVPFLAHATMEPQTCTAHVKPDGVEIWAPTQDPPTTLLTAALAADVPDDKVVVHRLTLGGGFGRRAPIQEYVRQAVLIAREVDQPVKLIWSREEDIQHDRYRPFGMARLKAGLDEHGMPIAWSVRLAGPSFVASLVPGFGSSFIDRTFVSGLDEEMPYDVPNYLVDYVVCDTPVPLGVWRAINYTQNAYYKECFVDEMAHQAGADPYQYRRRLLRNSPTNLAVLDAAAKHAGWDAPLPPGRYRGIALNQGCGSYCAQVVEISVAGGELRVHRVISAIDPGHIVNPLSVAMQNEGGVVYALTAALCGEITIKDGAAVQSNFHDYEMLRIGDAPKVETVMVPSGDFWGGVGEPPVPPLAPALCNAIFAATGKRIRSLPIKHHDLGAI
jgi:isoquinoline 1-oxidoreductase subunit beta